MDTISESLQAIQATIIDAKLTAGREDAVHLLGKRLLEVSVC